MWVETHRCWTCNNEDLLSLIMMYQMCTKKWKKLKFLALFSASLMLLMGVQWLLPGLSFVKCMTKNVGLDKILAPWYLRPPLPLKNFTVVIVCEWTIDTEVSFLMGTLSLTYMRTFWNAFSIHDQHFGPELTFASFTSQKHLSLFLKIEATFYRPYDQLFYFYPEVNNLQISLSTD